VKEEEKIAGSLDSVLVQGDSKVLPVEELVLAKLAPRRLAANIQCLFVSRRLERVELAHLARFAHMLGNFCPSANFAHSSNKKAPQVSLELRSSSSKSSLDSLINNFSL
jgi:hypothetical protein